MISKTYKHPIRTFDYSNSASSCQVLTCPPPPPLTKIVFKTETAQSEYFFDYLS